MWGKNTIHSYLSQKTQPNHERTIQLANFFGVSIDELLTVDLSKQATKISDQTDQLLIESLYEHIKTLQKQITLLEQRIEYLETLIPKSGSNPTNSPVQILIDSVL